ncbi:hypothetical protein [Natrarchaeobius oligotrophus]|uniref:hypothetical protein n=1 Tax=Natrarchaeobius oligotrophus TaxID=3455743 RepID=UPI000F536549|nr:hypothetical protein [Natrarchaeobius chitinivorans]
MVSRVGRSGEPRNARDASVGENLLVCGVSTGPFEDDFDDGRIDGFRTPILNAPKRSSPRKWIPALRLR